MDDWRLQLAAPSDAFKPQTLRKVLASSPLDDHSHVPSVFLFFARGDVVSTRTPGHMSCPREETQVKAGRAVLQKHRAEVVGGRSSTGNPFDVPTSCLRRSSISVLHATSSSCIKQSRLDGIGR